MKYIEGQIYNGFRLKRKTYIEESKSTFYDFEHIKTKALLTHLCSDDSLKSFEIGFKTLPYSDNGIAHVLEHALLRGSKKFPVKSLLTEVQTGSLCVDVNAKTNPDHTYYWYKTKNNKDFMNLLEVYLDLVLYPSLYEQKEILLQEGWHYELDSKDSELSISGVVYNEMKGIYESNLLSKLIAKSLFDNCYKYNSGGDIYSIPELNQKEFEDFHSKYYHPSNSYILVKGDIDIENVLKFIDEEYFSRFDEKHIDTNIVDTKPFSEMKVYEEFYSISDSAKEEESGIVYLNFVTNKSCDYETTFSLGMLTSILKDSILSKTLIDFNLCKSIEVSFDDSRKQCIFTIAVNGCDTNNKQKIKDVVYDTLRKIINEGIDFKYTKQVIDSKALSNKTSLSKDNFNFIKLGKAWINNTDYLISYDCGDTYEAISQKLNTNYFEELIEKYILNNTHCSMIVIIPNKNLSIKREIEFKEKLKMYKESLSEIELNEIIQQCRHLSEYQQTPDKKEDLAKIPRLSREDLLDEKIENYNVNEEIINDIKVLYDNVGDSDIVNISFMFNTKVMNKEERKYLDILGACVLKGCTKLYDSEQLENEVKSNLISVLGATQIYEDVYDDDFKDYYSVSATYLSSKTKGAVSLLREMIVNVDFDNKENIKNVVETSLFLPQFAMMINPGKFNTDELLANISKPHSYQVSLYQKYSFLKDILENFDEKYEEVANKCKSLAKKIYNKNLLTIAFSGSDNQLEEFKLYAGDLIESLSDINLEEKEFIFAPSEKSIAVKTLNEVNSVFKLFNIKNLGYKYSPKMKVLSNIVVNEYLYGKVRVEGGAYGVKLEIRPNGIVVFNTTKDPNIAKSIDAFDSIYKFLESFSASEDDMVKYIIGSIDKNYGKNNLKVIEDYICNNSYERKLNERNIMLTTTGDDIRGFAQLFKDLANTKCIGATGSASNIDECSDMFDEVIKLA